MVLSLHCFLSENIAICLPDGTGGESKCIESTWGGHCTP